MLLAELRLGSGVPKTAAEAKRPQPLLLDTGDFGHGFCQTQGDGSAHFVKSRNAGFAGLIHLRVLKMLALGYQKLSGPT